jgi:hypothetical protein
MLNLKEYLDQLDLQEFLDLSDQQDLGRFGSTSGSRSVAISFKIFWSRKVSGLVGPAVDSRLQDFPGLLELPEFLDLLN